MPVRARNELSLNSLFVVAFLAVAPFAANSSANASAYTFTQIDVPGAAGTFALGINSAGEIVGAFNDAADIIATSVAPSWEQVGQRGAIALIRTFLNFFLERDLAELDDRADVHAPP
jgi:hypothetical protein